MATLKQVLDKAGAKLVQFWQMLTKRQDAYLAKHGKYFQLLATGGRGVENGEEYDFQKRSPSDDKFSVDVDFPWTDKLPFEIRVDEWVGEDKGYTATVTAEWRGRTFTRSRNSKQEDTGWIEVTEEEIV